MVRWALLFFLNLPFRSTRGLALSWPQLALFPAGLCLALHRFLLVGGLLPLSPWRLVLLLRLLLLLVLLVLVLLLLLLLLLSRLSSTAHYRHR